MVNLVITKYSQHLKRQIGFLQLCSDCLDFSIRCEAVHCSRVALH